MEIVDANIILRYLLDDIPKFKKIASTILDFKPNIIILEEIIAEVVYVLEKVYRIERNTITQTLKLFLQKNNLIIKNKKTILLALQFYTDHKIDFIDSLLLAYATDKSNTIYTLDKKLVKLIEKIKNTNIE